MSDGQRPSGVPSQNLETLVPRGRLRRIAGAYLVALIFAASAIAVVALTLPQAGFAVPTDLPSIRDLAMLPFAILVFAIPIALFSGLPTLAVIIVGEIWTIRHWGFYACAGALIPSVLIILGPSLTSFDAALPVIGLLAGLIYWRIAGRGAGLAIPAPTSPGP